MIAVTMSVMAVSALWVSAQDADDPSKGVPKGSAPAPSGLTATKTCTSITLYWDEVEGAVRYKANVIRATSAARNAEWSKAVTEGTTATFSGLSPETEYRATVSARGDGDDYSTFWGAASTMNVATPACPPALELDGYRIAASAGESINSTLPAASGGSTPYTYSIVESLPTGLSFTASTRRVTGSTRQVGSSSYTYRVTDNDGTTDDATLTIAISELDTDPVLPSLSNRSALEQVAISPITLPKATDGNGTLTYSASGLPPGLSFSASTRRITGTPSGVRSDQDYTVTYEVEDEDGDDDEATFVFAIENDIVPSLPSVSTFSRQGTGRINETLPAATGGNGTLTYSATESDADGYIVSFDRSSREIVVQISYVPATLTVTYEVRDADGDRASRSVYFKTKSATTVVDTDPVLPALSDQSATEGTTISPITLPRATGGNGSLSYSASGLPPGLTFETSTRRIMGTSTLGSVTSDTDYTVTYKVVDEDGDKDEDTFAFTIVNDSTPTFASSTLTYERTSPGPFNETLPAAMGGNHPLTYSVTLLDAGIGRIDSFDPSTRVIEAYIMSSPQSFMVQYKVVDADGDFDTSTITFRSKRARPKGPAKPTNFEIRPKETALTSDKGSLTAQWNGTTGAGITSEIQQRNSPSDSWVTLSSSQIQALSSAHQGNPDYIFEVGEYLIGSEPEFRVRNSKGPLDSPWSSIESARVPPPFMGHQADHTVQYTWIDRPSTTVETGDPTVPSIEIPLGVTLGAAAWGSSAVGRPPLSIEVCERGSCKNTADDTFTVSIHALPGGNARGPYADSRNNCWQYAACIWETDDSGHMENPRIIIEQPGWDVVGPKNSNVHARFVWTAVASVHGDLILAMYKAEYAYLPSVMMHEFGHALGLEDLYKAKNPGNYPDSYLMTSAGKKQAIPSEDVQYLEDVYRNHVPH